MPSIPPPAAVVGCGDDETATVEIPAETGEISISSRPVAKLGGAAIPDAAADARRLISQRLPAHGDKIEGDSEELLSSAPTKGNLL